MKSQQQSQVVCYYYHQCKEITKLSKRKFNRLRLILDIIDMIIKNYEHVFVDEHVEECEEFNIILPFYFPLNLISKRQVELCNGKAIVPCNHWKKIVEMIYSNFLQIEMKLIEKCNEIDNVIYNGEDDRIRSVIRRFDVLLNGKINKNLTCTITTKPVKAHEIDSHSQFFPPCMSNLHQILRRTHRLSYESRYDRLID